MVRRSIAFCPYCSAKLPAPDVRFCSSCGTEIALLLAPGTAAPASNAPPTGAPRGRGQHRRYGVLVAGLLALAAIAIVGGLAINGGWLPGRGPQVTPRVFFITLPPSTDTPTGQKPGTFAATGEMTVAREYAAATLLADGRVLVAGGDDHGSVTSAAEIYDPAAGKFSVTGSMAKARDHHTATLLASGRVLIAGGVDNNTGGFAEAEIYDPAGGTFSATGSMSTIRLMHAAVPLKDGRVLILGGSDGTGVVATAELYDPSTGAFTPTGSMLIGRANPAVARLVDGRVLVVGGAGPGFDPLQTAEIYDPAGGKFTPTIAMSARRTEARAVLLGDGRVLVAGGRDGNAFLSSAEVFDPATGSFAPTGSLASARSGYAAVALSDGRAVLIGGIGPGPGQVNLVASAETYDPSSGKFGAAGSMATGRYRATAILLSDGRVLIAGGAASGTTLASAELYQP